MFFLDKFILSDGEIGAIKLSGFELGNDNRLKEEVLSYEKIRFEDKNYVGKYRSNSYGNEDSRGGGAI